ncbi:DUF92 domain-containing protein [candidate division KSB1 bacterium]|nr:DUF92 domain-containing protein [candidate division KSB1 bacterium]
MISSDWIFLGFFFIALLSLVLVSEVLRIWLKWPPESSRKFVHVFTGILVSITPFVLLSMWPMVILGTLFAVFDFFAIQKNFMRGMHNTKRKTYGTVFYPASFVILVLLLWEQDKLVLVTSMLIMAIADALAAVVGEKAVKPLHINIGFEDKTVQGSATMFLASFCIVVCTLLLFPQLSNSQYTTVQIFWIAAIVAVFATACEVISLKGSDNLTVPLGSAFVMQYLLYHSINDGLFFTLGLILSFFVVILSFKLKFLDTGGAIGAFLLGTLVFGVGRWPFTVPILTFFVLSSFLSKIGQKSKLKFTSEIEKSGKRDIWQVLANGGLAGILVLAWNYFPFDIFYLLFIGALAAVMADTWGTEIGVLSKIKPVSILTFKPVAKGASGGITFLGTAGSLFGAFILVVTGFGFSPHSSLPIIGMSEFIILLVSGLLASLVDSLLGATVQAKYTCHVCNKSTENRIHCGRETILTCGYRWINNDVVNFFCALSGILFVYIFWLIWH